MPFYIGWSPDGKFVYWNFTNATYAMPWPSGRVLPPMPAGGIRFEGGCRRAPGSTVDL